MADYIQVKDAGKPKYLPVESDNTISLETLQSAFPRSCGLCFEIENKCFVVKLHRGILYPPKEWWKFCYEPILDDVEYNGDDGYDQNDDESDHREEYDYYDEEDNEDYDEEYFEHNGKDNGYGNPPEVEDVNMLYYHLLNEKHDDDVESDYDDE